MIEFTLKFFPTPNFQVLVFVLHSTKQCDDKGMEMSLGKSGKVLVNNIIITF